MSKNRFSNYQLSNAMEAKFSLLDKLITLFKSTPANELEGVKARVKKELLMGQLDCTDEVADSWIRHALERC